jgi:hypothetical protein
MAALYDALVQDPLNFIDACYHDGYELEQEALDEIQLVNARRRFAELRPKIAALERLATDQHIDEIGTIRDLAPLMFAHTVNKSYPMTLLERRQFDRLTRWLGGLTSIDLSAVDASGCETIDEWLLLLDERTPLRVFHGSGTTGKLSFIPRTEREFEQLIILNARAMRDHWGPKSGPDMLAHPRPYIFAGHRYGTGLAQRCMPIRMRTIVSSEGDTLFLYTKSTFSADLLSLAGRIRTAESRGELGALELSPALVRRRGEMADIERERPVEMQRFFDRLVAEFRGRDVYINGQWAVLAEWAKEALKRGIRDVLGPQTIFSTGGGTKGKVLDANYREQVLEFLGPVRLFERYSMSEWMCDAWRCERGNYHPAPTMVPFLLDPTNGELLPRQDGLTGRYAAFDLLATTYWGGFVTGDEVTLSGWEQPCSCGRRGPYLHDAIRRYSEKEGGDDRVLCAGAPEAHDSALAFLAAMSA